MHGIRERDDRYPVVARYHNDDTREIECRAGIQWILQRRAGVGWHDIGYHLDRDVLIQRSGATGMRPRLPYSACHNGIWAGLERISPTIKLRLWHGYTSWRQHELSLTQEVRAA